MNEYRGLVNEGSTCYLNSLLQTLFMTPQFRRNVYAYVHDPKKIAEIDSIPYQLQKIFVKLQKNQSSVYSKGLLRSFQWNEVDSFQQHDVQEFCRKLFEAIEKAKKGNKWIENLYSGSTISFISCGKHMRQNPQIFMDLSLPIRNQYTNVNYKSLQQSLLEYLRPQKLQDKVQCEQCGEKVFVQKGLRLHTLPPILTLQLNRFELNLHTFEREKVNSFLYFPQVLEMGKFLNPFENIEVKGLPKDLEEQTKITQKKKSARMTDWGGSEGLFIQGKGLKPKRKNSDEIQSKKEKAKFYDEEGKNLRDNETRILTFEEEKNKSLQILKDLKNEKNEMDEKMQRIQKKTEPKEKDKSKQESSFTDINLEDDMLFGNSFGGPVNMSDFNAGSFEKSVPKFQKNQVTFEHQEQEFDPQKEYPQNTYVLYSVLVHAGGAYGGHYFAYIWDGNSWFKFNDNSVTKVEKKEVRKYGNPSEEAAFGANAYLLFYRNINTLDEMKEPIVIPEQLNEKVKKDAVMDEKMEAKKTDRLTQLSKGLILKIYTQVNKHETLIMNDRLTETVGDMKAKVKQVCNIEEKDQNWRMRRYNKGEDTMHQIYGDNLNSTTLDSLGFRETFYLAIETKKDQEEFQDYDPKNIIVKLNIWHANITILTEQVLRPFKLSTREEVKFEQFYHLVGEKLNVKEPVILKRNFSVGNPYQVFSLENYRNKTLIEMRFFNCINLFVEEKTEELKWPKEFEMEKYWCLIKYNNPLEGEDKNQQMYFDTRKTLGHLKEKLAQLIGLPVDEFRIKKSKQNVSEMTTYKKKLIDLRFITQQYLYLEEGKSSKGSIIVRKGVVELIQDKIEFNLHEEKQFNLSSAMTTVADLKSMISAEYEIEVCLIRIREFKAYQFGEIFDDSESLQKIKQKSLVWEEIECEDPRGIQIYFRVFDIMSMELGPLLYTFIQSSANYEELSYILSQESLIQSDKILVWKAHSNYIEKSMFFQNQWIQLKFIPKSIRDQPLYLSRDGQILILKEAEEAYHPKPQKKYAQPLIKGDSGKVKETGLKITVVEEKDDDDIENKEEQKEGEKEGQKEGEKEGQKEGQKERQKEQE